MDKKKSTGLLLSVLGVISLVLITAGVTYAFFSYTKEGTTENTLTTGTIEFLYDENENVEGNGIAITDALPKTDSEGKNSTDSFSFKITSKTPSTATIDYVVTARSYDATLAADQVKLYLTNDNTGSNKTVVSDVVQTYNQLPQLSTETITENVSVPNNMDERVIFTGTVPVSQTLGYTNNFVLKMWLKSDSANAGQADNRSPYEFVKKSALTGDNADTFDAEELIRSGDFITSSAYYAKPLPSCSDNQYTTEADCTGASETWTTTGTRAEYERIAYVSKDQVDTTIGTGATATTVKSRTIYSVSQATATGVTVDESAYDKTEQYYQFNNKTFKVKVNVYANGVVAGN